MRRELKIFALVIAALVIICILIGIYAIYSPFLSSHVDYRNRGISSSITWGNQTEQDYSEPIYAENGTVNGHFSIQVHYPTLVMAMVDEKVVPFFYNGSLNETHLVYPGDDPEMYVPNDPAFEITGIPAGVHDVTILTFLDPYDFNKSSWQGDGPIGGSARNFIVIMADSNNSVQTLMNQSISKAVVRSTTSNSNFSFISKSPLANRLWLTENIDKNGVLNYYVNIGHYYVNGNSTNLPFKIVQLMDYKQVPVQYDSADYVYTGHTTNSETATVPMSIKAPNTTGPHKLIVLLAINTHQALDPDHGDTGWEIEGIGWEHVDINVL
jgi:hypothetical protein